jgi:hypothetical protein
LQHGKQITAKKTVVDRFNDSRQEETRRLDLKRKMEHDEKMASMRLKKHKYDLQYRSTPRTPEASVVSQTTEDKQIEILRLQIRLAELTRDNSAHASSSQMSRHPLEEMSTPSSGMTGLSFFGGHSQGFAENNSSNEAQPSSSSSVDVGADAMGFNFSM